MDTGHSHPHPVLTASLPPSSSSSTPLSPEADVPSTPSRQQRLLRTRHARFSAKQMSVSGISARFSDLIHPHEDTARPQSTPTPKPKPKPKRNQETTTPSFKFKTTTTITTNPAGNLASSFGGTTLQDLAHSPSVIVRSLPKLGSIPVFQEARQGSQPSPPWPYASPTVYKDSSSPECLQPGLDSGSGSFTAMALKESSGNPRKSPATRMSPSDSGSRRVSRRPSSGITLCRFNSEQYIEHLEKHLELVKHDAYSPESNRPWKEKLKAAEAEKERLRLENQQMKAAFEAELQRTVEHMTATEAELRRKIRCLEHAVEQRESTIRELEMHSEESRLDQSTLDSLRCTIDKLEQEKRSLEQCNDNIIKRNDVLTQLLVISPTKVQDPPKRRSGLGRLPRKARPQSLMIPKIPSSPDAMTWRMSATPASPSLSAAAAAAAFSPRCARQIATIPFPALYDDGAPTPGAASDASLDCGTGHSDDMAPAAGVNSDRSTTASQASMSPTSCSPPLDHSSLNHDHDHDQDQDQDQFRPQRKNRSRRFLQGSTSLKPLLLPSLTGENGALRSGSPPTSPHRQPRNSASHCTDPTATVLLASLAPTNTLVHQTSSPPLQQTVKRPRPQCLQSHPGPPSHPISAAEHKNKLELWPLLPRSSISTLDTDAIWSPDPEQRPLSCEISPDLFHSVEVPLPLFSPSVRLGTRQRGQSLHHANADTDQGHLNGADGFDAYDTETCAPCRKRRRLSPVLLHPHARDPSSDLLGFSQEDPSRQTTAPTTPNLQMTTEISQVAISPSSPPVQLQPQSLLQVIYKYGMATSLTPVTLTTICRAWSKYLTCFTLIRRSPLELARRAIVNAWQARWAVYGMMSWWVLGLFIGPFGQYGQQQQPPLSHKEPYAQPATEAEVQARSDDVNTEAELHEAETPRPLPDSNSRPPGWTQRLLLWGRFSVTIMMAIGGAVVHGPGEMLKEGDGRITTTRFAQKEKAQAVHQCTTCHPPSHAHAPQTRTQKVPPPEFELYSDIDDEADDEAADETALSNSLTRLVQPSVASPSGTEDKDEGNEGVKTISLHLDLPDTITDNAGDLSTVEPDSECNAQFAGLGISISAKHDNCAAPQGLQELPLLSGDVVESDNIQYYH